jgi:hypothetical protein
VSEEVTASATKVVRVATAATLALQTRHTSGPLLAGGPIPPKVGQTTTYTIVWSVKTQGSPIAGASLTTLLPSYVVYTGVTTDGSAFQYDASSHTVTWNLGDLAAQSNRSGAFQLSLTPSSSQKGSVPALTGKATFAGYDRSAGVSVSSTIDALTTEMPSEPGYTATDASVQ